MAMKYIRIIALLLLALAPVETQAQQVEMRRVTLADAEEMVAKTLAENGAGENIQATAIGRQEGTIVSSTLPISASVEDLSFDDKTRSWNAAIHFYSEERPLAPTKLSGRYDELLRVPVLSQRMSKGETIAESDISWKMLPASRLRKNAILDTAQLIGKMPGRTISPDRYIRAEELISPPVINKGDIITMHYRKGGLSIATAGEAMESGAPGQEIRIRNSDSNVVIRAMVDAPGEVSVTGAGRVERPRKFSSRR